MFISSRGHAIHVHVQGPQDGPPVMLLHSLGTNLHLWNPQAHALASRFRVIRPDMRGHGASEAPPGSYSMEDLAGDALAVLDGLGVGRCIAGGVSIGGMIAQTLASVAPHRVGGLMLVDTLLVTPTPAMWRERADHVRANGIEAIAEALVSRWVTQKFAGGTEVQAMRAMLRQASAVGFAGCAEAIGSFDISARMGHVDVPALVIVGEQDQVTPLEVAEAVCAAVNGRLEVLAGAAHIPNLEQPDRLADLMLHFLNDLFPEGASAD